MPLFNIVYAATFTFQKASFHFQKPNQPQKLFFFSPTLNNNKKDPIFNCAQSCGPLPTANPFSPNHLLLNGHLLLIQGNPLHPDPLFSQCLLFINITVLFLRFKLLYLSSVWLLECQPQWKKEFLSVSFTLVLLVPEHCIDRWQEVLKQYLLNELTSLVLHLKLFL